MLTESPNMLECVTAQKTFLRAYKEAAKEPTRSHELCIRLALDAVWQAGREYQYSVMQHPGGVNQTCPAQNDPREVSE